MFQLTNQQNNTFSSVKKYGTMVIIAILLILLLLKSCEVGRLSKDLEQAKVTDTVFVNKPYKVEVLKIKEITKPYKVLVYLKDTAARNQAEQQTIITNVQYVRHNFLNRKLDFLKVDKIDTAGLITSNKYSTQNLKAIKIDGSGNVQVKHKKYIALKIVGTLVLSGATYLGVKKIINKP